MTPAAFRKHALTLPGAECVVQWGDDQVYKVAGKMFMATDAACTKISFKCSDEAFHVLTGSGAAIPAPYLARAKWVQVAPDSLPDAELRERIRQAYGMAPRRTYPESAGQPAALAVIRLETGPAGCYIHFE